MLSDKTIEIAVGILTVIGGAGIAVLKKYNLIRFGRPESKEAVQCMSRECSSHPKIVEELVKIHDQQLKNVELHKQHAEDLDQGREQFKCLREKINIIAESVAVLLDRTGGRPKGL